jgi:hypothetical protein
MTTQYKWLPEQPTEALLRAMHGKLPYCMGDIDRDVLTMVYAAMWNAAPEFEQ